MERTEFWQIIDEIREESDDIFDFGPILTERLGSLEAEEIESFAQNMCELIKESYRYDLWAVAYIVNGGCSDDGFLYFCGWLIAQGSERFQSALEHPEVIGEWAEFDENECEDILYAPGIAYHSKTGNELPKHPIPALHQTEPKGNRWEEDELESMYPKLCSQFC